MPTIQQLIRNARQPIRKRKKSPALRGCPQRKGVCARVYVRLVWIDPYNPIDGEKETTIKQNIVVIASTDIPKKIDDQIASQISNE
ncbi:hypothetical protein [Enterobacter hormaechei]|uniref:hypothetical protein n=1 Tax=Enterobacter hormaechei TaxID=158836 RepID=UPI003CC6B681